MQEVPPDQATSRLKASFWKAAFAPRRILLNSAMFLYCLALFLIFDFAYSTFTRGQEQARAARVYDPIYDHGLAPKFDGYDIWGEARYRLITNSLGFKDASTRDVPLQSPARRILLIGDSFAEGIGLPFESTFAGLLEQAGQSRPDRVEFLDAGVASYSPSIYYKKIKHLLDLGLKFDEVVLLSDSSDVEDEASSYFCIDDDPKYGKFCTTPSGALPGPAIKRDFFIDHFVVTNRLRVTIKRWILTKLGNKRHAIEGDHNRIGWTAANPDPAKYRPLGVEGGVARSLENMGSCRTCLRAAAFRSPSSSTPGRSRSRKATAIASRSSYGGTSVRPAARPSSICFRPSSPPPIATRTGMSIFTSSATIISPPPETGCSMRSWRSRFFREGAAGA
jgi:hypothetical protein